MSIDIYSAEDDEARVARFRQHLAKEETFAKEFGRFIQCFTAAETLLQMVLWQLTGAPETARAVLSGVRVDGAISFIRRIADTENWPPKRREEMENTLTQFNIINKFRNDLLHCGASFRPEPEHWVVSNQVFAHTPARRWEYAISIETLKKAFDDTSQIMLQLATYQFELLGERYDHHDRVHSYAWQYKSLRQEGSQRKNPKISPRRRTRPPALPR